jgi:regulator of protease activity HflC (stomatin/prohibitin superfamily)
MNATEGTTPFAPRQATEQQPARAIRGGPMAILTLAAVALAVTLIASGASGGRRPLIVVGAWLAAVVLLLRAGFIAVAPNESRVLILFGRYTGTVVEPGWWWVNPFTTRARKTVSLRVRNFHGEPLKVNDASGNPIEIAAVVVWRVIDTAKASFDVENFERFVVVQSETAVRHLANRYPYDDYVEGAVSLRRNTNEVHSVLRVEVEERLHAAGIDVLETRLTHLAYAPEIAQVMLRRQQAEAIVAARRTLVAGAVGLVEMALEQLAESDLVELDPERKAAMVSNLMVVLSGDHAPTPVINTGTLYT